MSYFVAKKKYAELDEIIYKNMVSYENVFYKI
jgi:hypothetical protein